jgi:large subunit ribosomal protein L25
MSPTADDRQPACLRDTRKAADIGILIMQFEFTAFPRTQEGRGASRRMRRSGKAPGIVYGGTGDPQSIELDHNALFHALRNEAFHASILTMKLAGSSTQVLLRDVQMHPFRNEILHVDFQRVDENRKIHMKVPLHFVNGELSPAVKLSGAIVTHVLNELDISCLPKDLPEFIEVDLVTLDVGHSIHVSSLKLPPGVALVSRGKLDPVVAAAVVPKAVVEEVVEAEAVPGAEAGAVAVAGAAAPGPPPAADAKPAEAGVEKKEASKDDKKKK